MQNPNTFYTSNNSTALEILPDNLNLNRTPLSLQKEALEKNPLKYHEIASEEKEEEEKSGESPTLPPVSIDEEIKEDSDPAHALANNINTRENVEALDSEGGNKIWIHNPAQGDNSIDFINESVDPEEELSQSSKLAEENENLSDSILDKGFVADSDEDNSEQSLLLALPSFGDQPFSDFDINEQDNNQDFEVNFDGDSSDQSILASLKETQASTNDHPSSSGSGSEISSPLFSG